LHAERRAHLGLIRKRQDTVADDLSGFVAFN
jgi:hypothetical protein